MYIETKDTYLKKNIEKNKLNKFLKAYVHSNNNFFVVFYIGKYYTISNTLILNLSCDVVFKENKIRSRTYFWQLTGQINTKNKKEEQKILPYLYKYIITREDFDEAFNVLLDYIPFYKEIEKYKEEIYRACFL